jgi:hypothetical protein
MRKSYNYRNTKLTPFQEDLVDGAACLTMIVLLGLAVLAFG